MDRACTTCGAKKPLEQFSAASGTHNCNQCRSRIECDRAKKKLASDPEAWRAKKAAQQRARRTRQSAADPEGFRRVARERHTAWKQQSRLRDEQAYTEKRRRQDAKTVARRELIEPGARKRTNDAWRAKNGDRCRELSRKSYVNLKKTRGDSFAAKVNLKAHKRRGATPHNGVTPEGWAACVEFHNGACAYCLRSNQKLTLDHVIPLAKGGAHDVSNIVPACESCNKSKGANGPIDLLLRPHLLVAKRMLAAHAR